ncbi:GNAT family N-acetyltransferase [Rubellimicrobium aerolatum]|uniref:Enhanced intracellular survival protein Eis n=1 Tax=Rubellimicrobium aerolatum TaxID=490979 RepID=A0ABW0SES9_9RHOB|nr:GNAT family N-acetyltransferase [Rubellimicrobium aerolatum]MBP1806941.1 putative acetyltransferase [Rubellimicrobium aerolatum]
MEESFKTGERARPATAADLDGIARLLTLAFGFDRARADEYLGHVGVGALHVVEDAEGRLLATAALLPTAHVLGGAPVPAASIAHVAIAPEARGRGLARPFMDALCRSAREGGAAVVSLFASARPVYRKCGFELAGSEVVYEADLSALPQASATFEPMDPRDPRIAAAYARKAVVGAGLIERSASHWDELLREPKGAVAAYGLGGDRLDAYLILDTRDPACLDIRDWHAADGASARALLAFLGRFRSVYPIARWHGAPQDDLVGAMPDKGWRLVHQEEWLLRVLDPVAALGARRYLPARAAVGLRLLAADGSDLTSLRLEIEDGRGQVMKGSGKEPTVSLTLAALGSLLTGFRSATVLARRGDLTGDERALRACDLAFAGPAPWVAEHF